MLSDKATWIRLNTDGTEGVPLWLWHAEYLGTNGDTATLEELRSGGYQRIDTAAHPILAEILRSQLAPLALVQMPGGKREPELWALREDIERADAVPVVLAFTILPEMLTALVGDDEQYNTSQAIPPTFLGNCALAVHSANSREWSAALYGLQAMPETLQALWRQLAEALAQLAGSVHWPPTDARLSAMLQTPGGYDRMLRDTQAQIQAAQSDAERRHWQDITAGLDSAFINVNAIRAQLEQRQRDPQAWATQWQELHLMAQQLAAAYWEVHEARAALSEKRKMLTHLPPSALDAEGKMPVAVTVSVLAFLNAMSQARAATRDKNPDGTLKAPKTAPDLETTRRGWARDKRGIPVFVHTTDSYQTELHVIPPDEAEKHAQTLDHDQLGELAAKLWAQVATLNDLDGDILLARLAHYLTAEKDDSGRVWITADHILRYRGREPKLNRSDKHTWDGGMRREDMALISAHSAHLDSQWVTIRKVTSGPDEVSWKSALFLVAEKLTYRQLIDAPAVPPTPTDIPDDTADSAIPPALQKLTTRGIIEAARREASLATSFDVAWLYEPGTWWKSIEYDDTGRQQIAKMSQRIVTYDPYHEYWEKRLAQYAFFHLRMNATAGKGTLRRKISNLFDELGLEKDERNPKRTREHFEQAMTHIVADGCLEHWDYAPGNAEIHDGQRHWLEAWLDWRVDMTAPALVREHYTQLAADRAALIAQLHPTQRNRKRAREASGEVASRRQRKTQKR